MVSARLGPLLLLDLPLFPPFKLGKAGLDASRTVPESTLTPCALLLWLLFLLLEPLFADSALFDELVDRLPEDGGLPLLETVVAADW